MNYRDRMFDAVVYYVGGFTDLAGDFNARDNITPIIGGKLDMMSDKEIRDVLTEPHRNVDFALEVLKELGLSLVI